MVLGQASPSLAERRRKAPLTPFVSTGGSGVATAAGALVRSNKLVEVVVRPPRHATIVWAWSAALKPDW